MKERINYIDRLKGLAILLVIMGHVYLFSMGESECVTSHFIGTFHMPLFMYLSGIVAVKGVSIPFYTIVQTFRKVARFLLPMFVFGLLFCMSFGKVTGSEDVINRVVSFVNAPEKRGYWYLMTLSVFYVSLLAFRINRRNSWIVDVIIAGFTWVVFFLEWKYTAQTYDPFCLLNCGNFYLFFILGAFSSKYGLIDKLMSHNWLFTIGLVGYIVLFGYEAPIHALQSGIKHILLPLCALLVIIPLFVKREKETSFVERQLEFIGKNTLDIYVIHYFIITQINLKPADEWLQKSENLVLSTLMVLVVSIVVAYLCIGIGKVLHQSKVIDKVVYGKF